MKKLFLLAGVTMALGVPCQAQLLSPTPQEMARMARQEAQVKAALAHIQQVETLQKLIAQQEQKRLLLLHRFKPKSRHVVADNRRLGALRTALRRAQLELTKELKRMKPQPKPNVQLLSG